MNNKRILVCDDDEGIADIVKIILENKGYNVFSLTQCDDIFQKIEHIMPCLILLDLWMPILSGEEITKRLKQQEETKNIPVIIISANRDTQQIAEKVHANGFLCKPFDIEELESIVEKYIP